MNVEPKPSEMLQAQVAAFAHEAILDKIVQERVFRAVGTLAAAPTLDYEFKHTGEVNVYNTQPSTAVVPRNVVTGSRYTAYLRSGASHEAVQTRFEYLNAYNEFKPDVTALLTALKSSEEEAEVQANYINQGAQSSVFAFEHGGQEFVAKIPHGSNVDPQSVDANIIALSRGKGIRHLEQLAASSYEDGVSISERVPGGDFENITVADINQATEQQLRDTFAVFDQAHEAGIVFDSNISNYLYDSGAGFGFVDYQIAGGKVKPQSVDQMAKRFATAISKAGLAEYDTELSTATGLRAKQEEWVPAIETLHEYQTICVDLKDAYGLDTTLAFLATAIEKYETPPHTTSHTE